MEEAISEMQPPCGVGSSATMAPSLMWSPRCSAASQQGCDPGTPLEKGTRAGFSTALGIFSCSGSLHPAGEKPDQPHLAGQKESWALQRWPGRGVQGAVGKQEVGLQTEKGKQAQVTWLVSGINGDLRLRATLENTAIQPSPLKYAHIKAIWNEYLKVGLRRKRTNRSPDFKLTQVKKVTAMWVSKRWPEVLEVFGSCSSDREHTSHEGLGFHNSPKVQTL